MWKGFGEEAFPRLVEAFLEDLKDLPVSAWE